MALALWRVGYVFVVAFGGILMGTLLRAMAHPLRRFFRLSDHARVGIAVAVLAICVILVGWLFGRELGGEANELRRLLPQQTANLKKWLDASAMGQTLVNSLHEGMKDSKTLSGIGAMAFTVLGGALDALLLAVLILGLLRCAGRTHTAAIRERTIDRTFSVQPTGTLRLETDGGHVTVRSSADPVVTVRAREEIHADSSAEADEVLAHLALTIAAQGRDVVATARYVGERPADFDGNCWPPVGVDFIVTVPTGFSVDLNSGGGGTRVGDLAGSVEASTGGGSLELGRIGGSVRASTGGGRVSVSRVQGQADLRTGGGSVRMEIAGRPKGDSAIETGGGSVDLTVDRTAAFTLDASAGSGRVAIDDLALVVAQEGPDQGGRAGPVNGGGPLLRLRTNGGRIEIEGR